MSTLDLGWYYSYNKEEFQTARISEEDRATHFYVIGASGSGKSKFLEFLIMQDLGKNGFGVIDPHGDLVENVKGGIISALDNSLCPEDFYKDVVIIDPTDPERTAVFNPLERLPGVSEAEQAQELIFAFKKIWEDSWGPRMEDILRNTLIVLIENNLTLLELPLVLTKDSFRETLLQNTTHPIARQYFLGHFNNLSPKARSFWLESTLNKINAFLFDDRLRQMLSSPKSSFNLRDIIDNRKVLLIKLAKGRLKGNADLLGSLLLTKIQMAAFSRIDIPQEERTPFYLYIDEFQNFATQTFIEILSEARKYGLSLVMAHQNIDQIPRDLRASIFSNTGIQVYFRVNRKDAEILAKESYDLDLFTFESPLCYYEDDTRAQLHRESSTVKLSEYTQVLQSQPPRFCFVKHKKEGGLILIQTKDVMPFWEDMGFCSYEDYLQGQEENPSPLGDPYTISRASIEADYQKRYKGISQLREDKEELGQEEPEEPQTFWHKKR